VTQLVALDRRSEALDREVAKQSALAVARKPPAARPPSAPVSPPEGGRDLRPVRGRAAVDARESDLRPDEATRLLVEGQREWKRAVVPLCVSGAGQFVSTHRFQAAGSVLDAMSIRANSACSATHGPLSPSAARSARAASQLG
jgi:hypothetical protein